MTSAVATRIVPSHCIGRGVQSGPGFNVPVSVATAPGGRMYVVCRSNMFQARRNYIRITMCTIDEEFLGQFTTFGQGDGQLTWPTSVAVSKDKVFVSDEHRHDVQVFDMDGNFLSKWGSKGTGPGQFDRPSGLAVDRDGNVLVVDSLNNRIQKLTQDGEYISEWGKLGSGPGELNSPWGITVSRVTGDVYVVDWKNGRVQQFDGDGNYKASYGDRDGQPRLERPAGVGVDSLGTVFASDFTNNSVQVYAADGSHLQTLTGDGKLSKWGAAYVAVDPEMTQLRKDHAAAVEKWETPFQGPIGVTVDEEDRILICESVANRIQVYKRA
jgi:DNA-binding beta-propeller fold protein YncE